jgi:hypothetical protein
VENTAALGRQSALGAAVMAVGLARNGAITAAGGRIQQSNFNDSSWASGPAQLA